jgi:hypothetical protein
MNEQMETLLENIKKDYFEWTSRCARRKLDTDGELSDINKQMIAEFNDELHYKVGNKYIKVITGKCVWGFIVNTENDKKFRKGDILKAAGWAAPARNAARGNIMDGGYTIQWTGPLYL